MYPNDDNDELYCDYDTKKSLLTQVINFSKYSTLASKHIKNGKTIKWVGAESKFISCPSSPIPVLKHLPRFKRKKELHDLKDEDWTKKHYDLAKDCDNKGIFCVYYVLICVYMY